MSILNPSLQADSIATALEDAVVNNPNDLIRVQDSVAGGRIAALAKAGKIGATPLSVSGIGNSIMYSAMPWIAHAAGVSGGLLELYDNLHGVPGNGTADMLARAADVPPGADLVAIQECTNDADNGSTMAQHETNMRGLIEFYLNRGQLPFGCFPPPRSDGQPSNVRTFQLGWLDYLLFKEYRCPFYFPWRQFVLPDATGGIAPAAGSTDNKHPGDEGHRLAGIALWNQMRGIDHVLPLPCSNLQGGIGLISDSLTLNVSSWGTWGDAVSSLYQESGVPGNWWRLSKTGVADAGFQRVIDPTTAGILTGDYLLLTLRVKTGGVYVNGYAILNLLSAPTYVGIHKALYSTVSGSAAVISAGTKSDVPSSAMPAGATSLLVLGALTADSGASIDIAQVQVWNLSAIRRL